MLQQADVLAADSRTRCLDHGEFSAISAADESASIIVEIGELLAGRPGRQRTDDITIADLIGIAAQEIAAASSMTQEIAGGRSRNGETVTKHAVR